jgi:hypothetical protein
MRGLHASVFAPSVRVTSKSYGYSCLKPRAVWTVNQRDNCEVCTEGRAGGTLRSRSARRGFAHEESRIQGSTNWAKKLGPKKVPDICPTKAPEWKQVTTRVDTLAQIKSQRVVTSGHALKTRANNSHPPYSVNSKIQMRWSIRWKRSCNASKRRSTRDHDIQRVTTRSHALQCVPTHFNWTFVQSSLVYTSSFGKRVPFLIPSTMGLA